jgi:hypothetical protein
MEFFEKIKEWQKQQPDSVAERLYYVLYSDGHTDEIKKLEKEFWAWQEKQ